MNKDQARRMAEEALQDCVWFPTLDKGMLMRVDDAKEAIASALVKCTQGQEPVAWLVCSVNADGSLSLEHAAAWEEAAHEHINDAITEHGIEGAASWVVRPAFIHPAPIHQADRKPLTDEQILEMVHGYETPFGGIWPMAFARAIEAAHGIREQE